jgi:DNA-binding NarL/FixJ family response regulator
MRALFKPLRDVEVVGSAVESREAIDLAVKLRPDVAIVAMNMLGMNGIETAQQLRKLVPATRILILSMHVLPEYVYQAFRAGAHGYVVKEARAVELIEAVRRLSKGKRYMSEAVSNLIIGDIAAERSLSAAPSGAEDFLHPVTPRTSERQHPVDLARGSGKQLQAAICTWRSCGPTRRGAARSPPWS